MRFTVFFLAVFLFICVVSAQWGPDDPDDPDDDDPQWPGDPDDDDPPWRPTPRPTTSRRPTPTRPTSTPNPVETEDPEDPPEPIFTGVDVFANATVYQPDDSTHHLTSPRTENLPNNTILAVWNDPAQLKSTLALYQSNNNGFSWYSYGTAKSTVSGRRLLEPHLLYVEGSWSGETNLTLLAVNAVDAKSTNIEIYASYDKGVTFEFVHRVAEGGAVGAKAVGEPHLLLQYVLYILSELLVMIANMLLATSASQSTTPTAATVRMHRRYRNSQPLISGVIGAPPSMLQYRTTLSPTYEAWQAPQRSVFSPISHRLNLDSHPSDSSQTNPTSSSTARHQPTPPRLSISK